MVHLKSTLICSIFLSFLLLSTSAFPQSNLQPGHAKPHQTVVLVISETEISSDCTVRPSVTINGTTPGPELRFKEGQNVTIRVINHLKEFNTTIHFHGISQRGSPFSDGTEKVSQFAIAPNGGYFDYEFQLDSGSAGSYIYHAHVDFHISSAYAAFIVEDDGPPPFKYDEELVLLFGDYYHTINENITAGLAATPFKWLGEPQSLVVNGDALASCNQTSPYGCTNTCHHHVAVVKPDKVYRVRVIGITVLTYLYFGIENHPNLDVIEADGEYVQPARTDHMELHSGQRYSFLLKTKSRAELTGLGSKTDFWGRIESRWRPIRDQGAFILRYEDGSSLEENSVLEAQQNGDSITTHPSTGYRVETSSQQYTRVHTSSKKVITRVGTYSNRDPSRSPAPPSDKFKNLVPLPDEGNNWLTEAFEPLDSNQIAPTAQEVTRRIIIKGQQRTAASGSINWYVNGQAYVETRPTIPFLIRAYTTGLKPDYESALQNNGFDSKLGVYPIKLNETVELVFINQASTAKVAEAHPWHLHGQQAYMIAQGTGEFNDENMAIEEAKFNRKHILRDTQVLLAGKGASYTNTTVPEGTQTGWMVMRMKAMTPGAFLFHCHTQPHALMGMGGVLLIGIEHLPPLPPAFNHRYLSPGVNSSPDQTSMKIQ